MKRRHGLLLLAAALLGGCGFELRRAPTFDFKSIYTSFAAGSGLGNDFKRVIAADGRVQVITDASQINSADVVLDVLQDQREKTVLTMNSAGQVREFQLRLRLRFKLRTPSGRELTPEIEILQQRGISFTESAVISKDAEEQLLYRDMQSDTVQQLMRRLAALRLPAP